jgi:hypothetical protein
MSSSRRAAAITFLAACAIATTAAPARAYDFSVETRIIAQAYDLRSIRLYGPDVWLGRRRYTQTLALDLSDLGDLAAHRRRTHRHFGPTVSFSSYMRVDHDFGDWTQGQIMSGTRFLDATDAVPELRASDLNLDLLYAYVDVKGLADGHLDLRVGRQLKVDALDWFAMDGVTARINTPAHFAIEAFGGLRVRDSSPLGSYQVELDGTTGADCREYVEGYYGLGIGHGSWQIIDRTQPLTDQPRFDDTGYCPQRDALMPTYGAAIETSGLRSIYARVVYRRSESETPDGMYDAPCPASDTRCLQNVGFYPNEWGQAPPWGVNEERVAATLRAMIDWDGGRAQASPYASIRYNLLVGLIDQADFGVRLRWSDWWVEPQATYFVPTFDGDSVFNVMGMLPSTEGRLAAGWASHDARWRATASVWLRQFQHDDEGRTITPPSTSDSAFGITATGQARITERWTAQVDLYSDNGYGGLRSGGDGALRWRRGRVTGTARAMLVYVATDSTSPNLKSLTSALQLGGGWQLADGVAVHGVLESAYDDYVHGDLRALAILDLAFAPEM